VRLLHKVLFHGPHTCPWWFGWTFDNPLRRLVHDPARILDGLVRPGDTVVDIGCGLGFFTIALARLVGPEGRVIAVDVQDGMLARARRRAERRGVADRIRFHRCAPDRLGLDCEADFVLAFWMVHEVSQPATFLSEVRALLRPSSRFLVAEPKGHVPAASFARTVDRIRAAGFEVTAGPSVRFSRSVLCVRAGHGQAAGAAAP
jgi:ubiquinone/menaquinone biosynthesis C-methylase UbiE